MTGEDISNYEELSQKTFLFYQPIVGCSSTIIFARGAAIDLALQFGVHDRDTAQQSAMPFHL